MLSTLCVVASHTRALARTPHARAGVTLHQQCAREAARRTQHAARSTQHTVGTRRSYAATTYNIVVCVCVCAAAQRGPETSHTLNIMLDGCDGARSQRWWRRVVAGGVGVVGSRAEIVSNNAQRVSTRACVHTRARGHCCRHLRNLRDIVCAMRAQNSARLTLLAMGGGSSGGCVEQKCAA